MAKVGARGRPMAALELISEERTYLERQGDAPLRRPPLLRAVLHHFALYGRIAQQVDGGDAF